MSVPSITLNDGRKMPILGLGTWKSGPGQVHQAVTDAIDVGYRHFDCAHVYQNENEVGEAIAAKIADGTVKREELFITSKLWNTFHRPDLVKFACETTLKNLQLDYLDLYLIHWPMAYKEGDDLFPKDEFEKTLYSSVDYCDTWKEMENLVQCGLTKSIGVSNFNRKQMERILSIAKIPPVVNQVECHPYLNQKKLIAYCSKKNVAVTAYSPLGSPDRPWAKPGEPILMDDPKVVAIAQKYKKTPAQILIRYQIDRCCVVIPKSVTKSRIASNFEVFNFKLTEEDIEDIDKFDCNGRLVPLTGQSGHPDHPFENDEY